MSDALPLFWAAVALWLGSVLVALVYFTQLSGYYEVRGIVVSAPYERAPNEGAERAGTLRYQYVFDGRSHIATGDMEDWRWQQALSASSNFAKGRPVVTDSVTVFISAANPTRSSLRSPRWGRWLFLALIASSVILAHQAFALLTARKADRKGRAWVAARSSSKARRSQIGEAPFLLLVAVLLYVVGTSNLKEERSYVTARGVVHEIAVLPTPVKRGRLEYTPAVRYSFDVEGQRYKSMTVTNGYAGRNSEADARELIAGLSPGGPVEVIFPRGRPGDAFIVRTRPSPYLALAMGAAAFIGFLATARRSWRALKSTIEGFK